MSSSIRQNGTENHLVPRKRTKVFNNKPHSSSSVSSSDEDVVLSNQRGFTRPGITQGRSFPVHGRSKTSVWWLPWKDDSKSKIVCSRWWSQISIALNPFLHLKMLQVRLPDGARLRSVLRSRTGTAQSPVQMADKWTMYRIVLKTSTKQSRSQMVRLPFLTFDMVRTFHIN